MPPLDIARLRAFQRWILTATAGMKSPSPEEVLQKFVRILEGLSPRLKLAIALGTPWAMLVTACSTYAKVWQTLMAVTSYISGSIYASVRITGTHPLQKQVLAYVVDQGLGRNARSLTLASAQPDQKQLMLSYMSVYDNLYGRSSQQQKQRHAEPESEKPALSYVPQAGAYAFWWRGHRITLRQEPREFEEKDSRGRYHIVTQTTAADIELSCLSLFGGAGPLRDFLKFVQNIPTKERTTTIYRPAGTTWDAGLIRSSRNLNAVTMNSELKDSLVRDVETYLTSATRKYYANRGIPYRRGFLFYGPPGTGKTSFANAMAGHFGLNVYMISLSTKTLNDEQLESLFEQLPNKCIVLLEDIDSAGLKRENMRKQRKREKKVKREVVVDRYGEPIPVERTGITLSGLLNVLDGIHSREGMITIMTSNTPDSLDPALIRPGRVDRKVLFSYASREVSAKLFRHIFEKTKEEKVEGDELESPHDIAALAEQFAEQIPPDELTPGDVQGFLLVHRADPVAAVAEAAEWVKKTLEVKASGANVAAFAGAVQVTPTTISAVGGNEKENAEGAHDSAHDDDDTSSEDTDATASTEDQRVADRLLAQAGRSQPWLMPSSYSATRTFGPGYSVSATTGNVSTAGDWSGAHRRGPPPSDVQMMKRLGLGVVVGQPTPPYSRSASRSTSSEEGSDKGDSGDAAKGDKGDAAEEVKGEEGKEDDGKK